MPRIQVHKVDTVEACQHEVGALLKLLLLLLLVLPFGLFNSLMSVGFFGFYVLGFFESHR